MGGNYLRFEISEIWICAIFTREDFLGDDHLLGGEINVYSESLVLVFQ